MKFKKEDEKLKKKKKWSGKIVHPRITLKKMNEKYTVN